MNFDNVLLLTPSKKINEWRGIVRNTLANGKNVIWVGDTETTGTEPKGDRANRDLKDRLLEIAMIAYIGTGTVIECPLIDSEGEQIFFHEYVNPFIEDPKILDRYNSIREIPYGAFRVHGIDVGFLEGKSGLKDSFNQESDFKLSKPAKTFSDIKPALEWLTCTDLSNILDGRSCLLAHNCAFDATFLDCEWIKTELLHDNNTEFACFESYFSLIDSLTIIKEMYSRTEIGTELSLKPIIFEKFKIATAQKRIPIGHGLEFLRYFYGVDNISRDVHGALVDSLILAEVYKKMSVDPKYQNFPVIKNKTKTALFVNKIDETGLISL